MSDTLESGAIPGNESTPTQIEIQADQEQEVQRIVDKFVSSLPFDIPADYPVGEMEGLVEDTLFIIEHPTHGVEDLTMPIFYASRLILSGIDIRTDESFEQWASIVVHLFTEIFAIYDRSLTPNEIGIIKELAIKEFREVKTVEELQKNLTITLQSFVKRLEESGFSGGEIENLANSMANSAFGEAGISIDPNRWDSHMNPKYQEA